LEREKRLQGEVMEREIFVMKVWKGFFTDSLFYVKSEREGGGRAAPHFAVELVFKNRCMGMGM
jgi:hypothetical protein